MERHVASCDLWPDITVEVDGVPKTYPVVLEVTYDFDPATKRMAIVVRGLGHGKDPDTDWVALYHQTSDANVVSAWVGFIGTARELAKLMGLPNGAEFDLSQHMDGMTRTLASFVQDCFVGRTCPPNSDSANVTVSPNDTQPVTPIAPVTTDPVFIPEPESEPTAVEIPSSAPAVVASSLQTAESTDILIQVSRDVSAAFRRERGVCTLEYTLFSEPRLFRAIIVARIRDSKTGEARTRSTEFSRKEIGAILADLRSDNTAYEVASFFGDTDTRRITQMSTVLQLGFAGGTELAMHTFKKRPTPEQSKPVAPSAPQFVEVFNNGQYITVPA